MEVNFDLHIPLGTVVVNKLLPLVKKKQFPLTAWKGNLNATVERVNLKVNL